jgi:hypothetical protein
MSLSRRARVVQIRKRRIEFITWSDHIDPKIALEGCHVESHFQGKQTASMRIVDWAQVKEN